MLIIPVHGTFTVPTKGMAWHMKGSAFHTAAKAAGLDYVNGEHGPFEWSGDLDGALAGKRAHTDWEAAGKALRYYMHDLPYEDRNVVTHSHGLQVALFAAAQGTKFRRLVSITGPIRQDLMAVAKQAKPNIGPWLHLYCPTDMVQWMGGCALDLSLRWPKREHPLATANLRVPKVGHSGLLSDSRYIPAAVVEVLQWVQPEMTHGPA